MHVVIFSVVLVGHSNCGGVGHCYDVVKDEQQAKSQPNGPILRWLTPLINLVRDLGVISLPKPEAMSIIANENVKMQVCQATLLEVHVEAHYVGC